MPLSSAEGGTNGGWAQAMFEQRMDIWVFNEAVAVFLDCVLGASPT